MPYFEHFHWNLKKTLVVLQIGTLELVKMEKFYVKEKKLNLRPKLPYWCVCRLELKINIVIFLIDTFEFFKIPSFMLKKH